MHTGRNQGARGRARRLPAPQTVRRASRCPATVQAILAARIDRLSPQDKRVLQCAAVIGKDLSFPLLHAVSDASSPSSGRAWPSCRSAEFLYERSLFPELEYTFKHALTQEVAYSSPSLERRRELHARIVGSDRDAPRPTVSRKRSTVWATMLSGCFVGEGRRLLSASR